MLFKFVVLVVVDAMLCSCVVVIVWSCVCDCEVEWLCVVVRLSGCVVAVVVLVVNGCVVMCGCVFFYFLSLLYNRYQVTETTITSYHH